MLLTLELLGVFAFALNGALTAMRDATLDLFGVLALGCVTALGGGVIRDVLLGEPVASLQVWWYLATATVGALAGFSGHRVFARMGRPLLVFDTAGLSLFCITGAQVALDAGLPAGQAILLGMITAVGGGTLRDAIVLKIPSILTGGLYAVPALVGAAIAVLGSEVGDVGLLPALLGAGACAALRAGGVLRGWHAPQARLDPPRNS